MDINFRKANVDDIDELVRMRELFLEELSDENYSKYDYRKELSDYFEDAILKESIIIYIAESDNLIVGTSSMVIWKYPIGFSGIGKNGRGYILNMYTAKAFRKKGIARTLLNKLVEKAIELKLEKLHLHATTAGTPLYESFGFKPPVYDELEINLSQINKT